MDRYPVTEKPLTLRLDGPGALVFFELLKRFQASGQLDIQYEAERRVLNWIFDELEGNVRAPIEPHYDRVLEAARVMVEEED